MRLWIKTWLTRRWMMKREREVASRIPLAPDYTLALRSTPELRNEWAKMSAQLNAACVQVDA